MNFAVPRAPEQTPVEPVLTEIRPPGGWQLINFRELWQFRDLLYFLTWRDVQLRYKQTVLGIAWAVLQPVMLMVVFTVFFKRFATENTDGIPYPVFTYTGLIAWLFFSSAISSAGNSVIGSEKLITKIYFPRLAIPFAAVSAALVDAFVAFLLLAVALPFMPFFALSWKIALLPCVVGLIFLAAAGVGTLLAALNVNYRDIRYVIPFMVQVWMFATPSIYERIDGPDKGVLYQTLVLANPMTGLVAAFRSCILGTEMPWGLLIVSGILSIAVFVLGCFYFRRMEDGFADVI